MTKIMHAKEGEWLAALDLKEFLPRLTHARHMRDVGHEVRELEDIGESTADRGQAPTPTLKHLPRRLRRRIPRRPIAALCTT